MKIADIIRKIADIVDLAGEDSSEKSADTNHNPVMVPPLQQQLELQKADHGKSSPVIDKLTQDDDVGQEPNQDDDTLALIKQLIQR